MIPDEFHKAPDERLSDRALILAWLILIMFSIGAWWLVIRAVWWLIERLV